MSHLWWQSEYCSMLREGRDPQREVFTARTEYGAVGPETLTLHHHGNITQRVPAALLIQAVQHMRGMHCRLESKHRRPRGRHGHL